MGGFLKMSLFFKLSLCASFFIWSWFAGASPCHDNFLKKPPALSSEPEPEEDEITPEKMGRDAIGGAAAGTAIDAVIGEISPASVATDAALGVGGGLILRTVAPKVARGIDEFVDDAFDDIFGDW